MMRAKYMDIGLKEYIENKNRLEGVVAELSSHGFLVTTENNLVYFLTDERYISPMSLVFEEGEPRTKISVNEKVYFSKDVIIVGFEEHKIWLENTEILELNGISMPESYDREILDENIRVLEDCIYSNGKHEGFAPLIFNIGDYVGELKNYRKVEVHNNLYTSVTFDDVIAFMEKLVSGDIDNIWKYSTDIIGFGPGITPSSNDFICGMMNTLVYAADYYGISKRKVYRLNEEFLLGTNMDSEKVSHYMMQRSIYGKTQKAVIKVIKYTMVERDRDKYVKSIRELIQFGDITGTDILCGVYYAFRVLESERFIEKLR